MASIGSLILEVVAEMKGFAKTIVREGEKAGSEAGAAAGKGFGSKIKGALSGPNMKQGLLGGLGLGVGLGAIGVATAAVGQLTQIMGDAITAAQEEEKSVAKLGAALKANIPNWDGQTAAIEETLASRMRLGFADDEQRESLATLVAVTKDATKALKLQRIAMDLARLRNIDLAAASDIVGKVAGGNIGILSRYGIQIKKGATATEALAAVTELAGGQAEAYAETNQGKLLASQIKVGEALEKLGDDIMPLVADATVFLADGVGWLVDALGVGGEAVGTIIEAFMDFNRTLVDIGRGINDFLTPWDNATTEAAEDASRLAKHMSTASKDDLVPALSDVGDAATDMGTDVDKASRKALVSFRDMVDATVADTNSLIEDVFDPIQRRQELAAQDADASAQRRILASADATSAEKRDAREALTQIEEDNLKLRVEMLAAGELNRTEQAKLFADLEKKLKKSTGRAKGDVQDLINKLKELGGLRPNPRITVGYAGHAPGTGPLMAEGGAAQAHKPVIVGDAGVPELFVPNTSGYIYPSVSEGLAAVGASGGNTYNVTLLDRFETTSVRDLGAGLRMLEDQGHLPGSR